MVTTVKFIAIVAIATTLTMGELMVITDAEASNTNSFDFDEWKKKLIKEADDSQINSEAAEAIISNAEKAISSPTDMSDLLAAYGNIVGYTNLQIADYLSKNPSRKSRVGRAMANLTRKNSNFPVELDEITFLTGLHYDETAEAVVYHYEIRADLPGLSASELGALRDHLEGVNPDAVCEISLPVLAQGFDMIYSYRDETGTEFFQVVRSYAGCKALGYVSD